MAYLEIRLDEIRGEAMNEKGLDMADEAMKPTHSIRILSVINLK